jgi:hypothetical protein
MDSPQVGEIYRSQKVSAEHDLLRLEPCTPHVVDMWCLSQRRFCALTLRSGFWCIMCDRGISPVIVDGAGNL